MDVEGTHAHFQTRFQTLACLRGTHLRNRNYYHKLVCVRVRAFVRSCVCSLKSIEPVQLQGEAWSSSVWTGPGWSVPLASWSCRSPSAICSRVIIIRHLQSVRKHSGAVFHWVHGRIVVQTSWNWYVSIESSLAQWDSRGNERPIEGTGLQTAIKNLSTATK